jgi:hypothetical protein
MPQGNDGRRQFEQLLLLADDHLIASAVGKLGRVLPERVEQGRKLLWRVASVPGDRSPGAP